MKKSAKAVLLVIAVLTVISIITALVMINAVWGDALFYMNSTIGNVYAVSYRWVCLASVVLVLFWIAYAYAKRAAVKEFTSKLKPTKKETAATKATGPIEAERLCTDCGKPIDGDEKYCPFCGALIERHIAEKSKEETH